MSWVGGGGVSLSWVGGGGVCMSWVGGGGVCMSWVGGGGVCMSWVAIVFVHFAIFISPPRVVVALMRCPLHTGTEGATVRCWTA